MYYPEMRKDCPMRGNLGNCSPVGGFCIDAVSDEICEAVHNAYDRGFFDAARMLKGKAEAAMDKWKYLRTEETFIGMNEETGELKKFNIFCCPKCEYEVTEWQLEHSEFNYCPKCGNKNEYDGEW